MSVDDENWRQWRDWKRSRGAWFKEKPTEEPTRAGKSEDPQIFTAWMALKAIGLIAIAFTLYAYVSS